MVRLFLLNPSNHHGARRAVLLSFGLALLGAGARALTLEAYLTNTTYIDSRTANQTLNYGHAHTVKVVINSATTSDGSICRGLLRLPQETWTYPPEQLLSATVRFYVWQDNTSTRNITLFPLLKTFVPGTGSATSPADGATWFTSDGANAWTSPGGDLDTNYPVVAVKEDVLDPNINDRFFTWDITALLKSPASRSELRDHGALLRIDETPPPASGMPRAPFTSCYDPGYSSFYWPALRLRIAPLLLGATVSNGFISFGLTNLTAGATNVIERSPSLAPGTWSEVSSFIAGGIATNWSEPLPTNSTKAFYRLRSLE